MAGCSEPVPFFHSLAVLNQLGGTYWLIAYWLIGRLLYGSGMRGMECLRLRVKDLDFTQHQITVRETKVVGQGLP